MNFYGLETNKIYYSIKAKVPTIKPIPKHKNDCRNRTKHNNLLDAFPFNLMHHR